MVWGFLPYSNLNKSQVYMCPHHPEPPSQLPSTLSLWVVLLHASNLHCHLLYIRYFLVFRIAFSLMCWLIALSWMDLLLLLFLQCVLLGLWGRGVCRPLSPFACIKPSMIPSLWWVCDGPLDTGVFDRLVGWGLGVVARLPIETDHTPQSPWDNQSCLV